MRAVPVRAVPVRAVSMRAVSMRKSPTSSLNFTRARDRRGLRLSGPRASGSSASGSPMLEGFALYGERHYLQIVERSGGGSRALVGLEGLFEGQRCPNGPHDHSSCPLQLKSAYHFFR